MKSISASLSDFIRERMAFYDSALDVSEGSKFDYDVIRPLLKRLGPDPTDIDSAQVIIDRLREYDSTIATEQGSALRDLFIHPLSLILEPFRRMARLLVLRGSWQNVESLTEDEADSLAANIFISREEGARSVTTLRLKFASPRSVTVTPTNLAYAGSLRFVPARAQSISSSRMATQVSGSYYYFDIDLVSEKLGDEYNLVAGSITSIVGITGCLGVEQLTDAVQGRARQSNLQLKEYAEEAIIVRNMSTERGIRTILADSAHFPMLHRESVVVVGRLDPAMERDVIIGPSSIGGIPQGVKGGTTPDLVIGERVHVGGYADIWVRPISADSDITEVVDIRYLHDEGVLVFFSGTGQVDGGNPRVLHDVRSFFEEQDGGYLPVEVGDIVLVEGVLDPLLLTRHAEFEVVSVSAHELEVDADISLTNLFNVSYEVRRRYPGVLSFSPDTLVAEGDEGVLLDPSGLPYLPVPGKSLRSEGVAAGSNISSGNVSLPLFYVDTVEVLSVLPPYDPVVPQQVIPEADPVAIYVWEAASETNSWLRVVYRHPTAFAFRPWVELYTLDGTGTYIPSSVVYDLPEWTRINTRTIECPQRNFIEGSSRVPRPGDLFTFLPGIIPPLTPYPPQATIISVVDMGGGIVQYEMADEVVVSNVGWCHITQGVTWAQMQDVFELTTGQDDFGFWYFDVLGERIGTRHPSGTPLATPVQSPSPYPTPDPRPPFISQGWRVIPRLEGYSFSTQEDPIFSVTDLVFDNTDVSTLGGLRITYKTTPVIARVQDFLDTSDERTPGADFLARRHPPARVHIAMRFTPNSITRAPTAGAAGVYLRKFIEGSSVGENATAISNVVEGLGADEVIYPFPTIVEYEGKSRSGKSGLGRLLGFYSHNGFSVPLEFVDSILTLYRMAQFVPGTIVVDDGS